MSACINIMRPPLEFFISGYPAGQPRARATAFGGHARMYTPKTLKSSNGLRREHPAAAWKEIVRSESDKAWNNQDSRQWVGPLRCDLTFYFPRPKSHFRSNGEVKPNAPKWHTAKPDRDNCDKLVLDSLTQLGIWPDDQHVCDGRIAKLYTNTMHPIPGVLVRISEAFA